jgi:hypothetical protein
MSKWRVKQTGVVIEEITAGQYRVGEECLQSYELAALGLTLEPIENKTTILYAYEFDVGSYKTVKQIAFYTDTVDAWRDHRREDLDRIYLKENV